MSWMNRKTNMNILQIGLDAICLILSYIIAVFLTGNIFKPVSMTQCFWVPILFGIVYIFMMFSCEMYHRSTFTYQDRTIRYIMKSCILAAIACLVMIPFTLDGDTTLNILLIYILSTIIIISVQYLIVQEIRQASDSRWKKHAIFIGYKENIQEYLYYIKKTSFQVEAAGYFILDDRNSTEEKNLGDIQNLETILKDNIVDEVIFAVPSGHLEEIKPYFFLCKNRGITVRIAMDFFEDQDVINSVHTVGTIPVFTYQTASLNDFQNFIKRFFDIAASILALCFTLLVSVFIIPLIKIQTGGSAFIPRKYLSVNGRTFTLYCFRTKSDKYGKESFIGRFLRRTSMNNLPMFWNVLRGDMCMVGSLPIAEKDMLSNHKKSITVKPGLTGTWRFADSSKIKDENYLADLNSWYIQKWSFTRDAWLILKTAVLILTIKSTRIGTSLFDSMEDSQSNDVGYSFLR